MSEGFDLDVYLERIGFAGPRKADLATLARIHSLQPAAVPFENLDPLLGRPVLLDPANLQSKLVGELRGGYCFELNSLLALALERLGFSVVRLAARVRWRAPPERPVGARTHMLLRVDLAEGQYLADVGFGGRLFAAPIRLEADSEQHTAGDAVRLVRRDGNFTIQVRSGSEWGDLYSFILEPQVAADYDVANWYLCTHPTSFFRGNLLAERLAPDYRVSLFNRRLTRTAIGGASTVHILASAAALSQALETEFAIRVPVDAETLWSRIPKG